MNIDYQTPVKSIISRSAVVLKSTDQISSAGFAMERNNIGSVLVANTEGNLAGVVTDRDLALALSESLCSPNQPLETLLGEGYEYIGVNENGVLSDVIQIMKKHSIRRVPVLQETGNGVKCRGVIAIDDLVRNGQIAPEDQAEIIKNQLSRQNEGYIGRQRVKKMFRSYRQKEQKYKEFIKQVSQDTHMSESESETMCIQILIYLLRMVPEKEGKKFLAQLPSYISSLVSDYVSPREPEQDIDLLIDELAKEYDIDIEQLHSILNEFWRSLSKKVSLGELNKFLDCLPKKAQKIFLGSEVLI